MKEVQSHRDKGGKWTGTDMRWSFTLFGTAVGAGILYLPITMSLGGIWALIFMSLFIFPMTYLAHRGLCRVILATDRRDGDITEAVEDHFGQRAGFVITLIYFLAIYSICLVYAVGITNEFNSFFSNILHVQELPRWLLSLVLIAGMTLVVLFGTNLMTRVSSVLVFPLIALLFILSILGIPHWKTAAFHVWPDPAHFISAVLMGIPVLVFAMNFSPIISTFAVSYRQKIPDPGMLDRKTSRVIRVNSLMLFVFVMFFVFSLCLALAPERLQDALHKNISAMTVIAGLDNLKYIPLMASFIAIAAIVSSYFGHLAGSREGLNGLIIKWLRRHEKDRELNIKTIDRLTIAFHMVTMWMVAVFNVTIVDVISAFTAPFIAIILYLMPVYAIHRVPRLAPFKTPINVFVFSMGLVTVGGYIASRFF